jgi:hypothetical protein
MRVERALKAKKNRQEKSGRPWEIFISQFRELLDAADSIKTDPERPYRHLLERSIAITAVTSVEAYYKNMLDLILTYCDQELVDPVLAKIHPAKYDISELLQMHEKDVHPLDLISANQSFQNIEAIDSVFSKFIGKSLWGSVLGLKIRLKDKPENEFSIDLEHLDGLKKVFEIRHELVHSAGTESPIVTEEFWGFLVCAMHIVSGTNLIIGDAINSNLSKAYFSHLESNELEREQPYS